ncbi:MAG: PLDc N-terminal domain-containing protein [Pirellulaceae bacterium]
MDNNAGAGGLLLGGGMLLVMAVIGFALLAFWIWALIDAIKNPRLTDNERLIWIIVILLTSWLGALIYIIVGRKK